MSISCCQKPSKIYEIHFINLYIGECQKIPIDANRHQEKSSNGTWQCLGMSVGIFLCLFMSWRLFCLKVSIGGVYSIHECAECVLGSRVMPFTTCLTILTKCNAATHGRVVKTFNSRESLLKFSNISY